MKVRKEDNTYSRNNGKNTGDKWTERSEQNLLNSKRSFGWDEPHDISSKEYKQACDAWEEPTWRPGKVSEAHNRRNYHGDFGTHQRGPDDMTNEAGTAVKPGDSKFFKKPGGSGQRSGE
jgi:hypothetical protein